MFSGAKSRFDNTVLTEKTPKLHVQDFTVKACGKETHGARSDGVDAVATNVVAFIQGVPKQRDADLECVSKMPEVHFRRL